MSKQTRAPQANPPAANVAEQKTDFARQAEEAPMGIVAEFWDFLKNEKKWWLTPIIIVLLVLGVLVFLSGTAVAPFIYPMI